MYKRLVGVGNSLAFTVDRPIRELLGIDRETVLQVTTDGQRLIVEPVRDRTSSAAGTGCGALTSVGTTAPVASVLAGVPIVVDPMQETRRRAKATYFVLYDSYGLTGERLRRFHHSQVNPLTYVFWLDENARLTTDPHELAAMRRNERCFAEVRAGRGIEKAMELALVEEPLPEVEPKT